MNGTYNGNGDTMGETVINHIDSNPGMLRKDNSPIFRRSNIGREKLNMFRRFQFKQSER